MRVERARTRMADYLRRFGARATVSRKSGRGWVTIAADVPVMAESRSRQANIDPLRATSDEAQLTHLSFVYGTDVQSGDRVTLLSFGGTTPGTLTVASVEHNSLDVVTQADAAVEQNAVETYAVTIERYDESTGSYAAVLSAEAQVMVEQVGAIETRESGATGVARRGTLVFTPVPESPIGPGDWIIGIPWAPSATVVLVRPIVGDRLEVEFTYSAGGAM